MSKYIVDSSLMTGIADNIRLKTGEEGNLVFPTGFNAAIESLPSIEDMRDIKDKVDDIKDIFDSNESEIDKTIMTPVDIASFSDGADDQPMALTVAVDPVQDLNGYESPWPGGGGKNLLKTEGLTHGAPSDTTFSNAAKRTFTEGTYVTGLTHNNYCQISQATDAVVADNSITFTTGAKAYGVSIPLVGLEVGSKYTISAVTTLGCVGLSFYQQDGTFISGSTASAATKSPYTSIVPENTYYTLVVFATTENDTETTFSNIQLEKSDTATSFAPYSNICPISGWTGANVTRTGKNLVNNTLYQSGSTNVVVGTDGPGAPPFFLKAGTYSISFKRPTNKAFGLFMGGETQGQSTIMVSSSTATTATITITKDEKYKFWFYRSLSSGGISTDDIADFMLEIGSETTAYEAYQGSTYHITFPSSAGTVYGGTLTINRDGTGKLVVDRANVDLGTLNYTKYDVTQGTLFRGGITGIKTISYVSVPNMICSAYPVIDTSLRTNKTVSQAVNNPSVDIVDNDYSDSATFKTAMSGVQLVYELATPVTYELTDLEVIKTLKGLNNIFANTGKINEVEYSADSQLCITNKLNELNSLLSIYTETQE